MVWDYDLQTRHAGIDQDHQEILVYVTAFLKVLDARHDDRAGRALATLYDRIAEHFAYEEKLMAEAHVPGARDHAEAHRSFLHDVKRFADQLAAGGVTESFRQWAHGRFVSWFRFHIKAYDIALGRTLVAREEALTRQVADAMTQPSEERR